MALSRLLLAIAIVFVCSAGGVYALAAGEVRDTAQALEAHPRVDLGDATPAPSGKAQTILLIGSDHRANAAKGDARSDTMMLVRLDPRAKAVTVLSVPRDLEVTIKGTTAKLNASYAWGGAALTVKTLRQVLRIGVDHVIDVDFAGFRALVDRLGCVYTDVDRHYYNRNVGTAATNYASIDIDAGYQKLCGSDALDYVRYRHGDNDLVRAARQHDFLRQARAQIGVLELLRERHALLEHTRTDIRGSKQVLALAKLAVEARGKPVQEIPFPATLGGPTDPYVHATPAAIHAAVRRFLHPSVVSAKPRRAARAKHPRRAPGAVLVQTRRYTLEGRRAWRRVYRLGVGAYYGIQYTAWTNPPILDSTDETRQIGSRTFELFYDGHHLRRVALQTADGSWWVSNSLTLTLTNRQMLALAPVLGAAAP